MFTVCGEIKRIRTESEALIAFLENSWWSKTPPLSKIPPVTCVNTVCGLDDDGTRKKRVCTGCTNGLVISEVQKSFQQTETAEPLFKLPGDSRLEMLEMKALNQKSKQTTQLIT